jgi:hypothetical protein
MVLEVISVRGIVVHDGKLTEAGVDLCAMIWEHPAFTVEGKPRCWHKAKSNGKAKNFEGYDIGETTICTCGDKFTTVSYVKLCGDGLKPLDKPVEDYYYWNSHLKNSNPDLLTDLNAVHVLEALYMEAGGDDEWADRTMELIAALERVSVKPHIEIFAPAHIRLEALATVLNVECGECGGLGEIKVPFPEGNVGGNCYYCNGTKRVPIIAQWERKRRGQERGCCRNTLCGFFNSFAVSIGNCVDEQYGTDKPLTLCPNYRKD